MSGDRPANARATAELLQQLLLQRVEYRDRWARLARRSGASAGVSQAAVAEVIALHLWETGERPDTDTALPRALKDRVQRALAGEVLSPQTLDWFIGAFRMSRVDGDMLRAERFHDPAGRIASPANTLREEQRLPLRQRHRTVSVFERRFIGIGGYPVRHRTTQAIIACEDGVDSFPHRLCPGAREVTVRRGGRVTARHERDWSTPVLEITLPRPLRQGQVASLEYDVRFDPGQAPAVEYRRVAHARAQNVDIVVEFDPGRPPSKLWWAVWDDHSGGRVLFEEQVGFEDASAVHRFLPSLENAAAGFRWTW
ncbi:MULTISPECIES: hypothetical protein [unclassified Streptomyces]|uniref:hypothetical protein n=1 Tax=unclassified Streptomyces TaxID=2593676 RepID=UPI002886437B|nr:hypothetical protein [Streptomyces sp. DSM 41633]